jgi:hypothetical protein
MSAAFLPSRMRFSIALAFPALQLPVRELF